MTIKTSLWLAAAYLLLSFGLKAGIAEEAPASAEENREAVSVWFASNRKRGTAGSAAKSYTGERGKPHFGRCAVEFTPIPVMDRIAPEVSFYVPTENRSLRTAERLDEVHFWEGLTRAVTGLSGAGRCR